MSNGIGANPLNAISKVYLDQIAEKKDDTYLEPDMKKRQKNNEKARKDMVILSYFLILYLFIKFLIPVVPVILIA